MAALVERALQRTLDFNPAVAIHELRMHMRGFRPFLILLAVSVIAASAVMITQYFTTVAQNSYYGPQMAMIGRYCFWALAFSLMGVGMIALPTYAAGSITMESEKGTLDMLRVTLLTPGDVVTSKLLVIVALSLVVLLTTVPIAAWCVLLGGLEPVEVMRAYVFLAALFICGVALGGLVSSWQRRSTTASAITFGLVLLWFGLPLLAAALASSGKHVYSGWDWNTLAAVATVAVLGLWGLMSAWMLYVTLSWLLNKLWRRLRGTSATLIAGALTVAAVVTFGIRFREPLAVVAFQAEPEMIMGLSPPVQMLALLVADFAREVLYTSSSGGTTPTIQPEQVQTLVWIISTTGALFAAIVLWTLAIRKFRTRW